MAVAPLAARQFGVVSLAQLCAPGLSHDEVQGAVQRGWLHRLHRGVFAVGHRNVVAHGRLVAALLACGPTAFLSHRTAAAGLRVSSVARLLIELAGVERRSELERLITQCVRTRILDLEAIEAALIRHASRPGVANLKRALWDYRPHRDRHSDLERTFDKLIAGTAVPPPRTNVVIDGWELDCYWPEASLVVELDGRPYHVALRDMEKDKLKDSRLLLKGIRTMRVTELRLELEPDRVLADVIALTT